MSPLPPPRLILLYVVCLGVASNGLEVGVPERFLPPRNFNPHPYSPVEDPGGNEKLDPYIGPRPLAHFVRDSLPDIQEHPYHLFRRPLTRGDDGSSPVQFPKVPEEANIPPQRPPQLKQLLLHPARQQLFTSKSANQNKKYAFSYAVLDKTSGDDFSHKQLGAGGRTKGEYRVKLPDGRLQIVSYTADHRGYRADVRYDEENSVESIPGPSRYIQPAPPTQLLIARPQPLYVQQNQPNVQPAFYPQGLPDHGVLHHRLQVQHQIPHQIHLPKPAYKSLLLEYEDTTAPPVRDHTPIHEEQQEDDFGDYQENTVSSTPSYSANINPGLIQPVQTGVSIGERAGPVKFPPTPPPEPQDQASGSGVVNGRSPQPPPAPVYAVGSRFIPGPADQQLFYTTPASPVQSAGSLFFGEDGRLYSTKK